MALFASPHSPAMTTPSLRLSHSPPEERSRSYTRPYCSPRLARSRSRPRTTVAAATKEYASHIATTARARKSRAAELGISPASPGGREDMLEFVVDVPVWSAGCFADLSTLHALRDTTLAHTHSLIAHLSDEYALHASYRLLARRPTAVGWGSVRLAPSFLDGEGRPSAPRRTSFVATEEMGRPIPAARESAVESEDEGEAGDGGVKPGYSNGQGGSEDEEDEEADELVKKEVEEKGYKEGEAFVLELNEVRTLVLV